MAMTLEQLQARTTEKLQGQAERRAELMKTDPYLWNYRHISPRQKRTIDQIDVGDMFKLLEDGQTEMFCWVIGILIDMKVKGGYLSEQQLKVLELPQYLFENAVGA